MHSWDGLACEYLHLVDDWQQFDEMTLMWLGIYQKNTSQKLEIISLFAEKHFSGKKKENNTKIKLSKYKPKKNNDEEYPTRMDTKTGP